MLFIVCTSMSQLRADILRIEAEASASLTPVIALAQDSLASGKACIEIAQGKGIKTGEASYNFEIKKKGVYYLWMRVWWIDSCGNSITAIVDGGEGKDKPFTIGQDGTYKSWHWVNAKVRLPLDTGRHTLLLKNREDGIKIDQIIFSSDRRMVPVGIE